MKRRGALLLFAAASACALVASAQPTKRAVSADGEPQPSARLGPAGATPPNLRAHVGTEHAARLLRASDPDERIRGIQRLASIGTPEAIAMLVQATSASAGLRADSRALLEIARALAKYTDNERAREALLVVVNAGNPGLAGRLPQPVRSSDALNLEEGDPVARTELAREIAAIALARSGADRALEQLYGIARGGGSGQPAAMLALGQMPPRDPGFFGTSSATMPAPVVRMLGQLGDLRALEILHAAARSTDVTVRSAALVALAELGDERAIALARAAIAEKDARLRAAAGEAFVLLGAPERVKAVAALVSDEATTAIGVRLAERVHHTDISTLLAARAEEHPDRELRVSAIRALGRSPDPGAAKALVSVKLLGDRELQYHAALALARSPAPGALQLVAAVAAGNLRGLGVRAYIVRALVRGERSSEAERIVTTMLASREPRERALAVFARVALGDAKAEDFLADQEPRVRRAAVMGALAAPSRDTSRALLARLRVEPDATTRQVLAVGLLDGDPDGALTTTSLVDRAESGGADAALSAYALSRRADEGDTRKLGQLLASKEPTLRAHAVRGLTVAPLADASGRLANAYAYETDVEVRRAIVAALAARTKDSGAPARQGTLALAAELDPDGPTRKAAQRALEGASTPLGAPIALEAAWLRLTLQGGAAPGEPYLGSVVRSDGVAVPIVFDDDGYAIVPGLPPGESRLVLAPRLPAYQAPPP